MSVSILSLRLRDERDVVAARRRARQIAELLDFDGQDQTRIATAVSEIARNAVTYARGGLVEFAVEGRTSPQLFAIRIVDGGPGIADLDRVLNSPRDYVAVDAHGCAGAREWPRRISLTPHGMARIPHRLLLIQGERKRAVFEQAVESGDMHRWPILAALEGDPAMPLQVHWHA